MHDKSYKYRPKDFFYLQRFPRFLGVLLFLGAELFFLAPVTALTIHLLMNEQLSSSGSIKHGLMALALCMGHYFLFFFTLRTRQGVGEKGIYNIRKGLLSWEQIGTIHLAAAGCTASAYDGIQEHRTILAWLTGSFSMLNTYGRGSSGGAAGAMLAHAQRKNRLVFHVKGLTYNQRFSLLRPLCGNVTFRVDLPVLGKSDLLEQFSVRLQNHPDWERVKSTVLNKRN